MILSGKKIQSEIGKNIIISDFNEDQLNTNSYNLRLHDELMVYISGHILDMKKKNDTKLIRIGEQGFILQPGQLYLGRTLEYTETHKYVPMINGRSSIGRLGICVHITAGFGDVGFKGYWTLEITCVQAVKIYPFIEMIQIYYSTVEGEYEEYKSGKYQNNDGIQPCMIYKEF